MNASDQQFYHVAESAPDPIFIGCRGAFVYANPAALRLFGATSPAQLLGQAIIERIHPDHREIVAARIRRLDEAGENAPLLEEIYLRLDGSPVDVEVSAVPFRYRDADGGLVFVRDISGRKRAERGLQRNELLLRSIIDNSAALIFVKDTASRYLLINRHYSELFHVDNAAMQGRRDDDLFAPDIAAALRAADRRVLAAGTAQEFEETVPQDDGLHTYLSVKFPLRDETGAAYAVCGIATDISERKRSEAEIQALNQTLEARVEARTAELRQKEQELREALELNESIVATSLAGILVYRPDGQCVRGNPAAAEIVGGSLEQLLAQNFRSIASWQASGLCAAAERVLASGRREEHELHLTSSFGRNLWAHAQLFRFLSRGTPHLLLMLTDITERHSAAAALAERERAFRSLAENVPDNIIRYDLDGRVLYLNPALERTLGRSAAELIGKTARDAAPDGRYDALAAAVRQVAASGDSVDFEQIVPGPDGQPRYHMIRIVAEAGPDGRTASILAVGRDLTAQKAAEEQLQLAASVFDNSAEGVLVTDAAGIIVSVNPAFTEITGYTAAEAIGGKPSLLRSDRQGPEFYRAMWQALNERGRWQGELWNRKKGGAAYLEWLTIDRIADRDGQPVRYVSVFHDITEIRRKDQRIQHLAFHDALTGLPNRTLMHDRLQHALDRARREETRLAVIFIDLDRFKAVNDGFGHDMGDLLLQKIALRIRGRLRATDTVARLGGDEFVVLMEDLREAGDCAHLATELIADIAKPMKLRGHTVEIGASMGMAFFPEDGSDALELMKRADMAMYAAKAAGRNTYRFFQADMLERTSQRLALEMELRRAIAQGSLELHYQPKVALAGGRPVGVEALVRWRHPGRGLVPPAEFIPLAEDSGLIVDLGQWVLDAACRQAAAWRQAGRRLPIAVNVSARELDAGDLVERLTALAARHDIAPGDLEIELTESAVMAHPDKAAGVLGQLRRLGVTVAVDDFGTGYSSLAYLRRLPIDVLKIDRSFVMAADRDDEDAQIVRTILALGRALKLTVVAEGIETPAQAELLRELGCDLAQGYFYAPPLPAPDIDAWLAAVPGG